MISLSLLLLSVFLVSVSAFRKRSAVLQSISHDPKLLESFEATPDYTQRVHVREFFEHNAAGGHMHVRHELESSLQCRSVDHVEHLVELRCGVRESTMAMRFEPGTRPPANWHVGAVLIGSEAWKCATKAQPDGDGQSEQKTVWLEDQHEPFFRRILSMQQDGDVWRFETMPEVGTVCISGVTVNIKTHKPENMTLVEYMQRVEEMDQEMSLRKREAGEETPDAIDFHRTWNLASIDVNYNRWAEKNRAGAKLLAMPADLAGLKVRCLECWLKFHAGLDITIKGHRVEPSSEFVWDLWRVRAFGKLSMALHLSLDFDVFKKWRTELFIRASVLRMVQTKYFTRPTTRFPLLSYLGITLLSCHIKVDLTAMARLGVVASFRVNSGFRINNAEMEFGFERVGQNKPQLIRSATLDGELIPLDFVLKDGSHGYAFLAFGPHAMLWPWVVGTGQIQRVLNFVAWTSLRKSLYLPLPVGNIHAALQVGSRFTYDDEQQCIINAPEYGMSIWVWHAMEEHWTNTGRDFYAPGRGISYGFGLNYGLEFPLTNRPLAEPSCLYNIDAGWTGADDVCDQKDIKCEARCAERNSEPTICRCMSGSLVQQCADESMPFITHPDGGLGATVGEGDNAGLTDPGQAVDPLAIQAAREECAQQLSCDACALVKGCGWCAGAARCMFGSPDVAPSQCFESDWLYDSCFRDPELRFTNLAGDEQWAAGELRTLQWTARLDVPVPFVAIAYRWAPDAEWLLAAHVANTGSYELRVPDGVPAGDAFQVMVLALPKAPEEQEGETPPITAALAAEYGRAYGLSPLIKLSAPTACAGPNGESGSCVRRDSCQSVGGALLFENRRNPREGCEAVADPEVRCCTSPAGRKRTAGAARIATGMFGACPPCGTGEKAAVRPAYCLDGSAEPRLLSSGDDECHGLPMPALTKPCDALPACEAKPIKIVEPREMFSVDSNVAFVGQPFSVSWQGGKLDGEHELQLLTGAGCGNNNSPDQDGWTTIAKLPPYSGSNQVTWSVPANFVPHGAPQWTRLRVRVVGLSAQAVSSQVLVAQPLIYEIQVNGQAAQSTVAEPELAPSNNLDLKDTTPFEEQEQQDSMLASSAPPRILGSLRVFGSVSQTLLPFGEQGIRHKSFDVGGVTAIEVTFTDDAARSATSSLSLLVGNTQYTIDGTLAAATYRCDTPADGGFRCTLDREEKSVEAAQLALSADQLCLFDHKYAANEGEEDMMVDERSSDTGEFWSDNVGLVIGVGCAIVACCVALVAVVCCCVVRRERDNDAYVYDNPLAVNPKPPHLTRTTTANALDTMTSARI